MLQDEEPLFSPGLVQLQLVEVRHSQALINLPIRCTDLESPLLPLSSLPPIVTQGQSLQVNFLALVHEWAQMLSRLVAREPPL